MLLHGGKNEDVIRIFFNDVYELYVKVSESVYSEATCLIVQTHPSMFCVCVCVD